MKQQQNTYVAIMAGGIGSRFWPISTTSKPKQFIDVLSTGETLLQATYNRFKSFIPEKNIFIVTHQDYINLVQEQLTSCPGDNIVGESKRKNTAPCVALIAHKIHNINPKATLIVAPSDHIIGRNESFKTDVKTAIEKANTGAFVTFGIKPTYPNTGYGYICYEETQLKAETYKVERFTEKPSADKAIEFFAAGNYLWNSGIFVWRTLDLLDAFERHMPKMHEIFLEYSHLYNSNLERAAIEEIYDLCEPISIDYAILEKSNNVYVIPAQFNWSDLGTWNSAWENSWKDKNSNVVPPENAFVFDTKNSLIHNTEDKLVVVGGSENMIVVNTKDALLVFNKENEQHLKHYVNSVKQATGKIYH